MAVKVNKGLPAVPAKLSIVIIFIASLCCINSYDGTFVFDDSPAIVNNPDVSSKSLASIFENDFWGNKLTHKQSHRSYRPLTILTFRFNRWIRGYLNPVDFHIINLILHTVACILLYFIFKKFLSKSAQHLAFYAAVLFAVHPVHCEAVSGIVGRADILCAIFVWLSLLFYDCCIFLKSYCQLASTMLMCTICISAAMLCKEIGITAIGICLAYDLIIVNRRNIYDILNILIRKSQWNIRNLIRPMILCNIGVILLAMRFSLMGFSAPTFQPIDNPASFVDGRLLRHLNYQYIYSLNAWLLICPEWLSFDWSMGCVPLITDWDPRLLAIIFLWIVMGPLAVRGFMLYPKSNETRYVAMAMSMLTIPFLPASNLFFNVGFVLAERTLYLPSAGYCFLVIIGLEKLSRCFTTPKIPLFMYIFLIFTWFSRSWMRSDEWRYERTLFRSALTVCPLNAKVHYNVAKNAADLGNNTLAEAEYLEALRLNPEYAQAMNNLGNLLKDQMRYDDAEKLLRKAVKLQPDFPAAWMNLGIVLAALKRYEESEECYRTSLTHRRNCPDCHYNLGLLYLERKDHAKAIAAWAKAIEREPKHRRAWTNTIRLLDDMGMTAKALEHGKKAVKLLPDDATISLNIANILGKLERYSDAEMEFQRAAVLDPTNPTIFTNLGVLYHRWNKFTKAREMYTKALKINPNSQSAKENLQKLMNLLQKKKSKRKGQ